MAKKVLNIGASPNDGTGDPIRTSLSNCKDNFDELYLSKLEKINSTVSGSRANDLGGSGNTINGEECFAMGKDNSVIPFPERGKTPSHSHAFGYKNIVNGYLANAIGYGAVVDGELGFAIGNSNVASGNDAMAIGAQCITGRRMYDVASHGCDSAHGLGGGNKTWVIIANSEGDVSAHFPTTIQYIDPPTNTLMWALHPYLMIKASEQKALTYLILKTTYSGGSGTKIYFERITDLGVYETLVLGSYSPELPAGEAGGNSMLSEGRSTNAASGAAHSEGTLTRAWGGNSHSEGQLTRALGLASHAEGANGVASGSQAHVEGANGIASGHWSHCEGIDNISEGTSSHAEGEGNHSVGANSHVEGHGNHASGYAAHAEGGDDNIASGSYAHVEGRQNDATGNYGSHAEGYNTLASGEASHSEGLSTIASGNASHAEGNLTKATGNSSHSEGYESEAFLDYQVAHASGKFITTGDAQYTRNIIKLSTNGVGWWDLRLLRVPYGKTFAGEILFVGRQISGSRGVPGEGCAYKYNFFVTRGTKKDFATTDVNISSNQITVTEIIKTDTPIIFETTGTIPGGLETESIFYAIYVDATHIQVKSTIGGSAIDITTQGSGTHTYSRFNFTKTTKTLIGRSFVDDSDTVGDGLTTGIMADLYTNTYVGFTAANNGWVRLRLDGLVNRLIQWVATIHLTETF